MMRFDGNFTCSLNSISVCLCKHHTQPPLSAEPYNSRCCVTTNVRTCTHLEQCCLLLLPLLLLLLQGIAKARDVGFIDASGGTWRFDLAEYEHYEQVCAGLPCMHSRMQ